MTRTFLLFFTLTLSFLSARGQASEKYLKANAIRIGNVGKLSDSIYTLLSPYQIIMFGEMHGTNESAQFVNGLTTLFTNKGDSVQVGLEIPAELMSTFLQLHTDSSVYQSEFFSNPPYLDGRESVAWANLILQLNKNPKVKIFFFDTNRDPEVVPFRDTLMSAKIKIQFQQHATWKMITLSGNFHNRISDESSTTSFLKRNLAAKICSINMEYKEGTCNANFKHGLEIKQLGSYPSVFNSTEGYDNYLILLNENLNYPYNGLYYTKNITAVKMVNQNNGMQK